MAHQPSLMSSLLISVTRTFEAAYSLSNSTIVLNLFIFTGRLPNNDSQLAITLPSILLFTKGSVRIIHLVERVCVCVSIALLWSMESS